MEYDTGVKMTRATGINMDASEKKITLRKYKRQVTEKLPSDTS